MTELGIGFLGGFVIYNIKTSFKTILKMFEEDIIENRNNVECIYKNIFEDFVKSKVFVQFSEEASSKLFKQMFAKDPGKALITIISYKNNCAEEMFFYMNFSQNLKTLNFDKFVESLKFDFRKEFVKLTITIGTMLFYEAKIFVDTFGHIFFIDNIERSFLDDLDTIRIKGGPYNGIVNMALLSGLVKPLKDDIMEFLPEKFPGCLSFLTINMLKGAYNMKYILFHETLEWKSESIASQFNAIGQKVSGNENIRMLSLNAFLDKPKQTFAELIFGIRKNFNHDFLKLIKALYFLEFNKPKEIHLDFDTQEKNDFLIFKSNGEGKFACIKRASEDNFLNSCLDYLIEKKVVLGEDASHMDSI